ncbi:unnamed protein product [Rhodiola kirilowii]
MLGFISKNVLRRSYDSKAVISANSVFLLYPRNAAIRFFSADDIGEVEYKIDEPVKAESEVVEPVKDSTFTISYLVKFCGLTAEAAQDASKLVHLRSAKRSRLVLRLLRDNGFSNADISRLVTRRPSLIVADPERSLKPKFKLFASLGAPPEAVVKMLLEYPEILHKSLDKILLPSVELLRSILHTDEKVLRVINMCRGVLRLSLPDVLGPNVRLLRDEGVSDDLISAFLYNSPHVMMMPAARFAKTVDKARKMLIGARRVGFLDAFSTITSICNKDWERKVSIFEKWGWSADDLNTAFSKQPKFMELPEKKIEKIMNYFVNVMELDPLFPVKNPNVLMQADQIIPRCSIIRYLLKMGVVSKDDFEISTVLESKEDAFIRDFVKNYTEVLPELLDLYAFCKKRAAIGRSQPVSCL